ncbi:glycosyltransferase family 4 protein [Microbacterium sp. BWT-B31]|uniref:glycosyltransferase family 4 protein n=1 Tax=Microbacterium sp. BWT-B31 TaxID=3232072 RepID=UPI0035275A63
MTAPRALCFVVPEGVDDPLRASGGNVYDLRVAAGLSARGWDVRIMQTDASAAASALSTLPAQALVLVDGLVAGAVPAVVEREAQRLRIVVLAHMVSAAFPGADPRSVEGERRALRAARSVITTSEWTRAELTGREGLPPERVAVALPGTAAAPVTSGTATGGALLCVGVVAAHKGQDVLVDALRMLDPHPRWRCTIAGSLAASPAFADRVARSVVDAGLADRIAMVGVLDGPALDSVYARADLVVAPSRVESYGMVVADALGRGIPVVASAVGGIPQTVAGSRGAVLVPPGDAVALSRALGRWMDDPAWRACLRDAALRTRSALPRWNDTVDRVEAALASVRHEDLFAWPP